MLLELEASGRLTLPNSLWMELSYANPFQIHLKGFSAEGTNHFKSLPRLPQYNLNLVKIGWKLKVEFLNNEILSFPYFLDMTATVKDTRTQIKQI